MLKQVSRCGLKHIHAIGEEPEGQVYATGLHSVFTPGPRDCIVVFQ